MSDEDDGGSSDARKTSADVQTPENFDQCAQCNQPFSAMFQNLRAKVPLAGGRATQRMKHTCRVCTRLVCSTNNSDGCSAQQPVPQKLWSRKLVGSIRKPDAKLECAACKEHDGKVPPQSRPGDEGKPAEGTCACSTGWVCTWCAVQVGHIQKTDMFGVLAKAEAEKNYNVLNRLVKASEITWLLKQDCDLSDEARHYHLLNQRTQRLLALLRDGTLPPIPRPPPKARELSRQITQSALRTAEESFNMLAGGKLKLGLKAARMAATGYRLSEFFTQYLLSEEFMVAWNMLLEQLGEFVEAPPGDEGAPSLAAPPSLAGAASASAGGGGAAAAEQSSSKSEESAGGAAEAAKEGGGGGGGKEEGAVKGGGKTITQKAAAALDLAKRFYYFSLHHISQQQREMGRSAPGGAPCPPALLQSVSQHMHLVNLLYKTMDGGQPSVQPEQEAEWFLQALVQQDGFHVVDYRFQSGEDRRRSSKTRGVRWPAFAVLLNPMQKLLLVAVRGTQEKHDHLIDIDLAGEWLFEPSTDAAPHAPQGKPRINGKVHRGMVRGARFIMDTYGLRRIVSTLPEDYKVRLGGHSLGAGTVALLLAMLKADPVLCQRDMSGFGFGMPACMEPALALSLRDSLTAVIHREDIVPRLSFTNLVRLREHFNNPEEKEWCKQQLEEDYQCLWKYVGWTHATEAPPAAIESNTASLSSSPPLPPSAVLAPPLDAAPALALASDSSSSSSSAAAAAAAAGAAAAAAASVKGSFRNIAGDLVAPGRVIYLRERSGTGEYEAVDTDCMHEELQRILAVSSSALHDHNMEAYVKVIRGLHLKSRLHASTPSDPASANGFGDAMPTPQMLQSSVLEDGSWRACAVCQRDVTDIMILKSDAHRAMATVHCRQCGQVCCKECAPAGDSLPDFNKELWAVRSVKDRRMVLPGLATLEAQRLCMRCQSIPSFC